MGQWRGKVLFMLIVYAAGFATALYVLAPADGQTADGTKGAVAGTLEQTARGGCIDMPAWAASARAGMEKAASFAEEQALKLADVIKTQMAQSTPDTGE